MKYLHFEDNEVSWLDKEGNKIEFFTFDSPAEAKQYFDQLIFELTIEENKRIEFVHYLPKFPPQRVGVWDKN